jgi:hypothetical protein
MKRIIFAITVSIFFILPVLAQQKVQITGIVLDKSTREAIEQASVRVFNAKDSSYVAGTATNMNGKFSVSANPGRYILNISYLGYKNSYVNVNTTKGAASVGEILLSDDGILLNEAVVTAKAAEIAVKGDTIEYNADSYKVQESAVVEDILKKMPGAEVDSNGKITINGKEVKKILVDGKEFFSDDPKVASKNLPAAMVDKLQVLDRKSDMSQMTGFDDGEDETVINLTVKKGMKQGLFGNAYAGMGNHGRYEANAMINYMQNENQFTVLGGSNNTNNAGFSDFATNSFGGFRPPRGLVFGGNNGITKSSNGGFNFALNPSQKFKWGGNIRYGNTNNDVTTDSYTQNYISSDKGGDQYETKKSWGNNNSDNVGTNLRFEWRPDSSTTIIFKPNLQYNKNSNSQRSNYLTTHLEANDSINWGKSDYYSHGDGTSLSGELEVSRQLGKKGRVLSFSLAGGFNNLTNDGYNRSETYFSDPNTNDQLIDQIFKQKNKGHNWSGYVSYVEPISHNNFLQLTYSYKKNYSETDKITYNNDGSDNYSILDTASTKRLENNFINQQIELNFKSVRAKYNYTIGLALQPSNSDSWTISPDTAYKTTNKVLNFAPVAQFNYMWDKRTNLRLDYKGTTSQPSTTQLSSVPDLSDPLNITYGNPDLKPTFDNRFRIRFRKFNPEQASAFMLFGGFNFTMNDIVNYSIVDEQGKRESSYKNVNGNWGANLRMIINRPLRNKKFSVNSMTFGSYSQSNGFINGDKNTSKNFNFAESMGLEYRSDLFDFGLRGNFRYTNTGNSLAGQENRSIYNYGGNINTTVYLPYNFTLETDMNYAANSGYSNGFKQNEWLWNASLSKQIFKAKNGTIRFKIYDILQQRSNISQASSAQYLRETITNTIDSYFMVHFVYRFQIFKGGAKQGDMNTGGRGFRGGPGGGGHSIRM